MHVTNKQSLTFSKKVDAYNMAFATKFATFLRAVPNNPIWGALEIRLFPHCWIHDVTIQAFKVATDFCLH